MNHIYFTALVNGARLAAALANSDQPERLYIVEPTEVFQMAIILFTPLPIF